MCSTGIWKKKGRTSDSRKNWGRCVDCALEERLYFTFCSGDISKKKKKKKSFVCSTSSPSTRIQQFPPPPPSTDALLSAPRILYFFFLSFPPPAVNVTPSNDINVTRACHAFARLFENNRISERSNIFFRE